LADKGSILVAGGAGYIGSHTALALHNAGWQPVVLDNLITGNPWSLRFGPYATGQISDRDLVIQTVRRYGVQAAILFAAHAYVGESTRNPSKYYRNNLSQSIDFLDALLAAGVNRLVFSSSCSIYGIQDNGPIAEDSRKDPLSPYAETKWMLEKALGWYQQAYGLRSVSLRYFNAAGASPDGQLGEHHDPETHLVPLAIAAALGGEPLNVFGTDYPTPDGTAVRDFIHVADLADAHLRALAHLMAGGASEQLNCGTGTGSSVREVIRMVEEVSGRKVPANYRERRQGDAPTLVADARKIGERLGWTPQWSSLRTIVETAWRWHSVEELRWVTPPAAPQH
jgi:UDP-arabinose 4-epimerase